MATTMAHYEYNSTMAILTQVTTVVIWCAYGLNVLAQSLALGIIITSIFMRQLLCKRLSTREYVRT